MRYVVSDLHLGHSNIIEYCDRPFSSVEEMNRVLVNNWNRTVDEEDVVYFLGDVSLSTSVSQQEWLDKLNGNKIMTPGNHDNDMNVYEANVPVVDSFVLQHEKYRFFCTHRPENIPDDWDEWAIHGHNHNNNLSEHPFINQGRNKLNVSVELTDYKPVSLETILSCLSERETMRTIGEHN
jgi:calcineurin-like phosphoesterase family protein